MVGFAPSRGESRANYEVAGFGDGNSTVDWFVRPPKGPPVLLDVKNRTKDLLESLGRMDAGERSPDGTAPVPEHDHALLFRSIEQKFRSQSSAEIVQGVWIRTSLRQEETELSRAFDCLDATKVHVAVLGDWQDDVHVLANDAFAKEHVIRVFRLEESRRFVFRES